MQKGSLRISKFKEPIRTDFNDWSDPKPPPIHSKVKKQKKSEPNSSKDLERKVSSTILDDIEIESLRQKIKKGLTLFSEREIRDIRLPYSQSLLLNLMGDGFTATADFIRDLLLIDDQHHKYVCEWKRRPCLRDNTPALIALTEGLTKAEIANMREEFTLEVRAFVALALHFSDRKDSSWHWLSFELFEQALELTSNHLITARDEAALKHLFALFLFDTQTDLKRAKMLVEMSMELSEGKSWKISETAKDKKLMYFESCLLLHNIYMKMAQESGDIKDTIAHCKLSLIWARRINCREAEAKALLTLATIYISNNEFNVVIDLMDNYLKLCKEENNVQGLCEGYMLQSIYHEKIGEKGKVIEDIEKVLKLAQEHEIVKVMAMAHHKLAMHYLTEGKCQEMESHASQAYTHYVALKCHAEMEKTRCLIGMAQAMSVMPQYYTLLLAADSKENIQFEFLMQWKTQRIPFFENVKLFQHESTKITAIKDSIERMKNEETIISKNKRSQVGPLISISSVRFKQPPSFGSFSSAIRHSTPSRNVSIFRNSMRSSSVPPVIDQ